jgi:hypothetical protein
MSMQEPCFYNSKMKSNRGWCRESTSLAHFGSILSVRQPNIYHVLCNVLTYVSVATGKWWSPDAAAADLKTLQDLKTADQAIFEFTADVYHAHAFMPLSDIFTSWRPVCVATETIELLYGFIKDLTPENKYDQLLQHIAREPPKVQTEKKIIETVYDILMRSNDGRLDRYECPDTDLQFPCLRPPYLVRSLSLVFAN